MLKKQLYIIFYLVGILAFWSIRYSAAQVEQDNNIASQPTWGPTGYDHVDYYYLPDVECYYSVGTRQFISLSGGRWIFTAQLPTQYSKYDLFSGYKVVINKPRPFLNFTEDKVAYEKFKGKVNEQVTIKTAKINPTNPVKLPQTTPPNVVPKIPVKPPVLPPVVKPHVF